MLPLTRHGTREMVIGTVVLLAIGFGLSFIHPYLSLIVVPVLIWLFAFFRDPERTISAEPNLMVSPADGLVSDVGEVDSEHIGERCLRIGIFLSVFNVHVNRAPCDGKVTKVVYKKGKFINAMSHGAASSDNESNTIVLEADGRPVAVIKQIVGLIARRIICTSNEGDVVKRGDRIGMIKFGSRTELYIPLRLNPTASVKVGQKVRGGLDIIARLSPQTSQEPATPIGASA
jgi:phosphatidylserine decarboxylase